MENIGWFNFEKKDLDFPFYRKNPHVPKWGWIIFVPLILLGFLFTAGESVLSGIISCLILVVPVLYFLKWDYKAIFQKPTLREVGLAVALFVGYMIYATVVSAALGYVGITTDGTVEQSSINLMYILASVFSLMGEEFMKLIPFLFFMRVIFKYTNNRKLAIVVSMILVMFIFASMHAYSFITLIFAIFVQGFGSIFEFYGYIKTKNVFVSYLTHLITDVFIFLLVMFSI